MKNDPTSYNAMARVYCTAVAVSALILSSSFAHAANPPVPRGNVSTTVNPTTGYHVVNNTTFRLPNGVSVAPTTSGGLPVVSKYPAGLQQTIPSGITIDAIKKTAPLSASVRATTQTLKGGAKTFFKGNLASLVLGAGLQQLLDGVDGLIEGGRVVRLKPKTLDEDPTGAVSEYASLINENESPANAWCGTVGGGCIAVEYLPSSVLDYTVYCGRNYRYNPDYPFIGYKSSPERRCFYRANAPVDGGYEKVPMSDAELDDAIDSSYNPDPTDWRSLAPHFTPDDVEITWAPTLQGEPITKTQYDADGNPHKITETNIWYDFDIRDNPSPQPKLDLKKREETKTYEDGVLTGTTTTESTASAGSDGTPPPDSPIDCDLFPTACAWFDWTQEEPVEPDTDLSGLLQEVPIVSETYTITGGAAACPAPMVLDLSVFGSREVSYQPLCDLASTMKYLYLALMSFAAAVLLNRSVNRV